MKKTGISIVLFLIAGIVAGCGSKRVDKVYSNNQMHMLIDEVCDVPYTIEDITVINKDPKYVEYTCLARDRNLTFSASALYSTDGFNGSQGQEYDISFKCNYVSKIFSLYQDEVKEKLADTNAYYDPESMVYYIFNQGDIDEVARAIVSADEVYAREKQYHDSNFTEKNPIEVIYIKYAPSQEEAEAGNNWTYITKILLNGNQTKDSVVREIRDVYLESVVEGEKYDIYLNDILMDYETDSNNTGTFGIAKCWYDMEQYSYYILCDVGYQPESSWKNLIMKDYVDALGGKYNIDTERSSPTTIYSDWKIGINHWRMKAVFNYDNRGFCQISVSKNGISIPIVFYNYSSMSNVSSTCLVGISIHQFAELIDASYKIDKDLKQVHFYTE